MTVIQKNKPANRVWAFIDQYKIAHVIFWTLMAIVFINLSDPFLGLLYILFIMVVVYINLEYLIPKYLPSQFLKYTVLLIVLCAVFSPIALSIISLLLPGKAYLSEAAIFFLLSFFFSGSFTVMKIVKDWYEQQQENKEIEKTTMQTELKFLKSQINPHFLFNTLNNLYALTLKKSDSAPEIVIKLSEMMRYMLYECNEKRVPLNKEIKYIKNYLDLEKLRQGERANITFECQGEVGDQKIAPLMFIPFLENSFKHGVNNRLDDGFVHILILVEGTKLNFQITNSKPPPSPSHGIRKVGGIGLMNVKRRLNLIYPNAYELNIEDSPHEYTVHLELELDK